MPVLLIKIDRSFGQFDRALIGLATSFRGAFRSRAGSFGSRGLAGGDGFDNCNGNRIDDRHHLDLERRKVIDVLPKHSVEETATWLKRHPEIEIVSRDRYGLYAQGARQGAPQAKQVADRFHLL